MAEHVSSTMHVFRGEKYRLLLRGGPTAKETVKTKIRSNGKCDPNGLLTVHQMDDYGQTHSRKENAGGVVNQAHTDRKSVV